MRAVFVSRFLLIAGTALISSSALAEVQLSVYGGTNWNFDSKVKTERGAVNDSRTVSWKGKSFTAPPYWGARGTYWFEENKPWGVALDYTHQKAYADINFGTDPVYDHLELTDGNNILTLNAMYRFQKPDRKWGFYVGGGPGLAIPSFEVDLEGDATSHTHEYQITGFAAQVLAGAQYKITQHVSGFAETKLSYTRIDGDIKGGGTTKTNIWSPHLLAGVSYSF
jgi:lipid A oxidase